MCLTYTLAHEKHEVFVHVYCARISNGVLREIMKTKKKKKKEEGKKMRIWCFYYLPVRMNLKIVSVVYLLERIYNFKVFDGFLPAALKELNKNSYQFSLGVVTYLVRSSG